MWNFLNFNSWMLFSKVSRAGITGHLCHPEHVGVLSQLSTTCGFCGWWSLGGSQGPSHLNRVHFAVVSLMWKYSTH